MAYPAVRNTINGYMIINAKKREAAEFLKGEILRFLLK